MPSTSELRTHSLSRLALEPQPDTPLRAVLARSGQTARQCLVRESLRDAWRIPSISMVSLPQCCPRFSAAMAPCMSRAL